MTADYVDASALVAVILKETGRQQVDAALHRSRAILVSDLCLAECSSAISLLGRRVGLSVGAVEALWRQLDDWVASFAERVSTESSDVRAADAIVRRYELKLRAPDAVHVAAAARLGARLVTLDRRMTDAANRLGVSCRNPSKDVE